MALQLIPKRRTLSNPSLIHLFSTSSSSSSSSIPADSDDRNDHSKSSTSNPPISSYFRDAKASPRRQQQSSPPPLSPRTSPSPTPSFSPPFKGVSLEEMRKNLTQLSCRPDPTPPADSGRTLSFQDPYKRNALNNALDRSSGKRLSMDDIRRSLRQMRASDDAPQTGRRGSDLMSDYSSAPSRSSVFGVTDLAPQSVFGKEIREFEKMMDKLNQKRLRELEEKETESRSAGLSYKDMRKSLLMKESLVELKLSFDDEKKKTNRRVRVNRSVR